MTWSSGVFGVSSARGAPFRDGLGGKYEDPPQACVTAQYNPAMTQGTQHATDDPRNDAIRISINGSLVPRAQATVSVFDSGFVLGDGVWEGFRIVDGHPAFLEAHLDRLYEGAKALLIDLGLDRTALTQRIYAVLDPTAWPATTRSTCA